MVMSFRGRKLLDEPCHGFQHGLIELLPVAIGYTSEGAYGLKDAVVGR
jgi:hypothetical protein